MFSDISTVAWRFLVLFSQGKRDSRRPASLADHRVKKSQAEIEAALTGDYRPELLFVLNQSPQNYRQIQHQIAPVRSEH